MKNFSTKRIARIAIVAALYFAVTLAVAPIAFGQVQFRVSEILVLLCFYNKDYCYSMGLGCLLANFFSPMWTLDVPFGTLATVIAVVLMVVLGKNLLIASLFPVIINGIIVGLELYVAFGGLPLWMFMASVAFGELVVVTIVGVPVFKLLEKNQTFMKLIRE
ncbi:MAG TPA: QueT transporter family protein [Oscillospiraceae bacterium]|nr:QueT transporter family protein [Oscillospiraceae bacterium]